MLESTTTEGQCRVSFQPKGPLGSPGHTAMCLSAVVMTESLAKSTARLSTSFSGSGIGQLAIGSPS